jgi:hypothetical protein
VLSPPPKSTNMVLFCPQIRYDPGIFGGLFAKVRHGNVVLPGTRSICVVGLEPEGTVSVRGDGIVVPCAAAAIESAKTAKKVFNGYSQNR